MNSPNRSEILRSIVGHLLASYPRSIDFHAIVEILRDDSSLASDIARSLGNLADSFRDEPASKEVTFPIDTARPLVEMAYEAIQKSRTSKRELFKLMTNISGRKRLGVETPENVTVRHLLENYFETASPVDINRLLRDLGAAGSDDPYLRGITADHES